jgi:mannosyltransferase
MTTLGARTADLARRRGLLAGIVALAAAIRWYAIGRGSIWIDEATSLALVRLPWRAFLRTLWEYEANMAFYYLLLRAWLNLGDSEVAVRSLSALFGTLAVLALYGLGRRLFDERVGLLAAALLSVNMFHLWFSQEARSYSLVVLLVILSLRFFVEGVEGPERRSVWLGYAIASVLAVYTHFFAVLVLAAQWLAVGPRRLKRIGPRRLVPMTLGMTLALLPLAVFVLRHDQGQIDWLPPMSVASVLGTLLAICGYNPLAMLVVVVGLVSAFKHAAADDDAAWRKRLLGLCLVFPMVVVALASLAKPLFFFRYFAICIPAATLLAARVLIPERALSMRRRRMMAALAVLNLAFGLLTVGGFYKQFPNWGGDWRSATEYVLKNRQDGDGILFHVSAGLDAYRYYEERVPSRLLPVAVPTVVFPAAEQMASAHLVPHGPELEKASAGLSRLWLVLHQREATALPPEFLAPYRLVQEQALNGISPEMSLKVALYERKSQ